MERKSPPIALEAIIQGLARWAHRRLPQFARRRMDTGDLVQESLFRALRTIGELQSLDDETLRRYLMACVNNLIRDEIRRAGMGEVANAEGELVDSLTPLDVAIEEDARCRYRAAMRTLSVDDQILLVGRVDLEVSYEDLARATKRPSAAAARCAARRAALRLARACTP